jgi:hypothetical protein
MLGEMGELPDIIEAALNHVSIRSVGRNVQPKPLPAASGGSVAAAGGRAGRDRSWGRNGGADARSELTAPRVPQHLTRLVRRGDQLSARGGRSGAGTHASRQD